MNGTKIPIAWLARFGVSLLLTGVNVVAQSQGKHRVTLDDMEGLQSAGFLRLSPTGDALVYVTGENIWLIGTRQGSVPRSLGKGMVPIWSPDGKRLAYYSRESGTNQLWVRDNDKDHAEQVTNLEGGIDPDPWTTLVGAGGSPAGALLYSWSPDSTKLVFPSQVTVPLTSSENLPNSMASTRSTDPSGKPLVLTNRTPANWTLMGLLAHKDSPEWAVWKKKGEPPAAPTVKSNQLFIVDILSKKTEQLTKDDGIYFSPDWSPDGQRIVCVSFEGRPQFGWMGSTSNIYVLDVSIDKKTALTKGSSYKSIPQWSPDGKWIAYGYSEGYSNRSVLIAPVKGGEPINATASLDRYVADFRWLQDSQTMVILYADGVSWKIARVDTQKGRLQEISSNDAAFRFQMSTSRSGWAAWVQSDASTFASVRVAPPGTSSSYALVDLNPQVQEWELGMQEIVRWKNRRGDDMEGILVKPVGYKEGFTYPLIVDAYPEIQNWFMGNSMLGNQAWASRGYAVFFPNARAPHVFLNPFRTEAFDRAARGPKGWNVTVDDVMSGVDELIRRGIVDPDRMGLYGFSNGGGVVNYLVARTGRFKCAVSVAGVLPDWASSVFLRTNSSIPMFAGGLTPWEDPAAYIQLSAVYHVKNVTTPMLLAVGDNDTEDFLLGTIEMYNGLRWFGKDVILLRYPGQGHGFTGEALKDFWERENAFFQEHLKPTQPPK